MTYGFRKEPGMLRWSKRFSCLLLLAALPLAAQTGAGRIQGTVKDTTDAVIPNARITAEHIETRTSLTTQSNRDGVFLFPSAQTGRYRVTAEASGLEKWQGEFELQIGQ